jgi:hypothetical protein
MPRDLVERAMAGDLEAFTELARLSTDRLYAIARLILRDSERAKDATQEALILAWRDLSGLRDPVGSRPGFGACWSTPAIARPARTGGASAMKAESPPSCPTHPIRPSLRPIGTS